MIWKKASQWAGLLLELVQPLGLLHDEPMRFLQSSASTIGLSDSEIEALINARAQAKADKNWAESDRIRDELKQQGIVLEDSASGTSWRRESSLSA